MDMRQSIFLACFFLLIAIARSYSKNQERTVIRGAIYDIQTRTPVPYVSIYLRQSQQGTSATERGEFSISIKKDLSDTLTFSAVGYKTLKIASPLFDTLFQTIYLEENVVELSTVTVSAHQAVDIIRQAMRNRENTYGTEPHKLTGIYRIADKEDGAYVRLAEAAIDIYDSDFMKKDSRIVDYLAVRHSQDFRTFRWKMDKLNSRTVEELIKPDLIKRPTRATHQNGFEKGFFYTFQGYSTLDDKEIYIISAKKNPAYEWPNYDATFYVRADDLAIIRVDRDYSIARPNWAKDHGVKTKILKDHLILKYKDVDGRLYLDYFLWNLKGEVVEEKSGGKLISFERNEEVNIGEVSFAAPQKKVRSAWERDFYKMTEPYNSSAWDNFLVSGTQLFKDVNKELAEKENLEAQFRSSANNQLLYEPGKKIKVNELKEDFQLLQRSLTEGHPALYRYTNKDRINQLFDSVYNLLSRPMTEKEFHRLTAAIVASIRCGHTQTRPSLDYSKFVKHRKFFLPVQTAFLNGQLVVLNNLQDSSLLRGDEILSVNGKLVGEIAETLIPLIEADGYIESYKNKTFGQSFSELYNTYFENTDSFTLTVKNVNGEIMEKTIPGTSLSDFDQLNEVKAPNRFTIIKAGIAMMKVGSFMDQPELNFRSWVSKAFTTIERDNVDNLIIDLRDNSGGRDDYAVYLYSFLAKQRFAYHTSLYASTDNFSFLSYTDQDSSLNLTMQKITAKDSLDRFVLRNSHPTLGEHETSQPVYRGNVYFFINGTTFSAASDFAAICQQNQIGTFIGEETGGAAIGNTSNGDLILTLPNSKIRIRIPIFMITNAVSGTIPGRGVLPDYPVQYTNEDIAARIDKELELILDMIK
jgi:C-terminal processing protease CtpA/Prc